MGEVRGGHVSHVGGSDFAAVSDADSDGGAVASAERVLNHQLSALLWLDSKSRELAGRVEAALTTAR